MHSFPLISALFLELRRRFILAFFARLMIASHHGHP
jgi:hypothetical protein